MHDQAEGEEKEQLASVLNEAKTHVGELEQTVELARGKMESEMEATTIVEQESDDKTEE